MSASVARELLDALPSALPRTQDLVLSAAERHGLAFLERLLEKAKRDGPDGDVLRNNFDIGLLETVIVVLREIKL